MQSGSAPKNTKDTTIKRSQKHPEKTEWILQQKTKQLNMTEWRPGNTKDAPSARDWDPQGKIGAVEAPGFQVFHSGQWMRSQ